MKYKDLIEEFEATNKTFAWTNLNIYPGGKIYTTEFTEWLAQKVTDLETTDSTKCAMHDVVKSWPTECVGNNEAFCATKRGTCLKCSNWNTLFNNITKRDMESARDRMDNQKFSERVRLRAKGEFFALKGLRDSVLAWKE